jgi:hypothetical protein
MRDAKGEYRPYDFETLARPELEDVGIFSPSLDSLHELQKIIESKHPKYFTKAIVICISADATPVVGIRGGSVDFVYEIESGDPVAPLGHDQAVAEWVKKYRSELLQLWDKAKESYFSYYPGQRPKI